MAGKKTRTNRNRVLRSAVLSLSLLSFIPVFGVIRQQASTAVSGVDDSATVAQAYVTQDAVSASQPLATTATEAAAATATPVATAQASQTAASQASTTIGKVQTDSMTRAS